MKDYLGLYTVNGKTFTDKIEAILEASQTDADISWDFHQERFRKIDWWKEPELSLGQLYKIRAQQIRDEYDYVVIMFSGGADSTNVIRSFLDNNIYVDEIIAGVPVSGLRDFKATANKNSDNNASEWLLTTMPYLHEVSVTHPNIKISINDFFETMLEFKTDEWLYQSSDFIHPTTSARYKLDKLKHLKQLAEQGKKIALVYGIEKPLVNMWEGKFVCSIVDTSVNVPRQPFDTFYPNVDIALFYSTPLMPQILVKSAHEVAKNIHLPQYKDARDNMYDFSWPLEKKAKCANTIFQRGIIPIIYPDINYNMFQAHKSKDLFMADHDAWFYNLHKDTRLYQLTHSDFSNFFKTIKPKYLRTSLPGIRRAVGFIPFSNHYTIGNIADFQIPAVSSIV
jgi:hypothetical protein